TPLDIAGAVVISGNTPADVAEVERIIHLIEEIAKEADIKVQLVPLVHADATSVANTLTLLFQRVIVNANGNRASTAAQTQAPGVIGVPVPSTTAQTAASVVLIPLRRYNALLMA